MKNTNKTNARNTNIKRTPKELGAKVASALATSAVLGTLAVVHLTNISNSVGFVVCYCLRP